MKHIEKVEFKNAFEEYIFNSSLAGFNHLNSKATVERFIWFIIHIFSFGCTCFLISYTWQSFMINPTVTTVETTEPHLTEVPMPGISVCSINKISKRRAAMYAKELSEKSNINMASIMENISLFGYLYEYNLPNNPDSLIYFQNFLEKWDYTPDGYFNTTYRLKQLQSPCEEVVQNCKWRGRSRPCTDIFATQLTMDGYCCVFNYISDPTTTNVPPIVAQNGYKPISFAPTDGLQFTVLSNSSDTFFTTIATEAPTKILLSLPTDFPDTTSGGLIEKIIDRSTETFLRVRSVNKMATLEIKKYSVDKRGCKFSDEIKTIFGDYSYSDCIMDCKIRSILALCQCVPYNFIRVFKNPNDYIQCSLGHLSCLNSYANKWRTLYPVDYEDSQLDREKQDSILCKECVPSCSDTRYEVSTESADIYINGEKANFSIVHITYENSMGMFNKQDAFFYWYDMISIFGGICSVTMGLSFISIVEIVYFFVCVTLKNNIKNYVRNRRKNEGTME